jgi:hypothetical protein
MRANGPDFRTKPRTGIEEKTEEEINAFVE